MWRRKSGRTERAGADVLFDERNLGDTQPPDAITKHLRELGRTAEAEAVERRARELGG